MFCVGCKDGGPKVYPVTGTVTMDSKPLTNVIVQFSPIDNDGGKTASGQVDAQGKYTLYSGNEGRAGAQPGKYKVYLTAKVPDMGPPSNDASKGYGPMKGGGSGSVMPQAEITFPQAWSQPTTTPLEVEVKQQDNTINIEVK
jgi:hypothetical protein